MGRETRRLRSKPKIKATHSLKGRGRIQKVKYIVIAGVKIPKDIVLMAERLRTNLNRGIVKSIS